MKTTRNSRFQSKTVNLTGSKYSNARYPKKKKVLKKAYAHERSNELGLLGEITSWVYHCLKEIAERKRKKSIYSEISCSSIQIYVHKTWTLSKTNR